MIEIYVPMFCQLEVLKAFWVQAPCMDRPVAIGSASGIFSGLLVPDCERFGTWYPAGTSGAISQTALHLRLVRDFPGRSFASGFLLGSALDLQWTCAGYFDSVGGAGSGTATRPRSLQGRFTRSLHEWQRIWQWSGAALSGGWIARRTEAATTSSWQTRRPTIRAILVNWKTAETWAPVL